MSLNAIATPAAHESGPLVIRCRSLTVAKVDSIVISRPRGNQACDRAFCRRRCSRRGWGERAAGGQQGPIVTELRRAFGRGVTATGCPASQSCPRAWASWRRSRWFSSQFAVTETEVRAAPTSPVGTWLQQPAELESGASRHVYGAYPMLCAAAVLPRFGSAVRPPDDIPVLVGQAYGQAVDAPHSWSAALDDARRRWMDDTMRRTEKAKNFQLVNPHAPVGRSLDVSGSVGEPTTNPRAKVRWAMARRALRQSLVQESDSGDWLTPAWLSDGQARLVVPRDQTPSDDLAFILSSCALRLPLEFSNAESEAALWSGTPEPWEHSPLIYRLPVVVIGDDRLGVDQRPENPVYTGIGTGGARPMTGNTGFNLMDEPWIMVLGHDGQERQRVDSRLVRASGWINRSRRTTNCAPACGRRESCAFVIGTETSR